MTTIRASEADRILRCPGSMLLTAIVERQDSEESTEGTKLHDAVGQRLVRECGASASAIVTTVDHKLNPFQEWAVDYCVQAIKATAPANWAMEVEVPVAYVFDDEPREVIGWHWNEEAQFVYGPYIYRGFILSGHWDVCCVSPDGEWIEITDFKFGYIPVDPAESNYQLMAYAVLAKRAYPQAKHITVRIVQPRNNPDEGHERVSSCEIDEQTINAATAEFVRLVTDSLSRRNELNTGVKQCRWCVGVSCPAIQKEITTMKLVLTPDMLANIKAQPDPVLLADVAVAAKIIERPIAEAKEALQERLESVAEVVASDGTRISQKITKGSIEVLEPERMYESLTAKLPPAVVARTVNYSKAKTIDALAEVHQIAKSGKSDVTAEKLYEAEYAPLTKQGTRRVLVFN